MLVHVCGRSSSPLSAQDAVLFNDTIEHNIAYGRLGASKAEVFARGRAPLRRFAHGIPLWISTRPALGRPFRLFLRQPNLG